jgi:hypothetical protein
MTRVYMKRRNRDDIYGVGKATSCETMFEGFYCFSFSQQYKVEIALNASSEFDPNILVLAWGWQRNHHFLIDIVNHTFMLEFIHWLTINLH